MDGRSAPEIKFDLITLGATAWLSRNGSPLLESPGFGRVFTDHMITLRWSADRGWHDGKLEPYGPLSLDPATAVLHYAQEIFEGTEGVPAGVRADRHLPARDERGQVPPVGGQDGDAGAAGGDVHLGDRDAGHPGQGLGAGQPVAEPVPAAVHDRDDAALGVGRPANSYLFLVIASPSGSVFSGSLRAVNVWLAEDYTRAAPGGTGAAKTGGNYAARSPASRRRSTRAATRSSGWTRSSTGGSRRWAG